MKGSKESNSVSDVLTNSLTLESDWLSAYKNSIKSVDELSRYIPLEDQEKKVIKQVCKLFHMRVTEYYLSLIQNPYNLEDPIRKQCIPDVREIKEDLYQKLDPLGEEKTSPTRCLVYRYPDRALLLVTNSCFTYCRHCTRKRLWHKSCCEPTLRDIQDALSYVKKHPSIREIIVSGGDPLTLPTQRLDYILSLIANIESVEVIRIGTRAPVVLPQRIDEELCHTLEKYPNLWINTQFNHPREITTYAEEACRKLQRLGIPISNQSVLLRGINDEPEVMKRLCQKLQRIRVRPYYLFQCDAVVGASHFRTSVWKGIEIIEKMRGHTSGMCIPTFVVDGEDGKGKIPLSPQYLLSTTSEGIILRNHNNETFFYFNPKN
jgi:lysine 2,3-aminomutase